MGAGAGVAFAAGVFMRYAVGFGVAAAAAALALVVDWWLALLIVFGALLLLVLFLALVSRSLFRRGTPLTPEQAIEEARLTKQVLRGTRAGDRRTEKEIRREITTEREQLVETLADLREAIDEKRRPTAVVGGALAAGLAAAAAVMVVRRLKGE